MYVTMTNAKRNLVAKLILEANRIIPDEIELSVANTLSTDICAVEDWGREMTFDLSADEVAVISHYGHLYLR